MRVILDPHAGICGGVRRAIQLAEDELQANEEHTVFVLGDIIHNEREVERLDRKGLRTIYKSDIEHPSDQNHRNLQKKNVLVRAHGEPPETFKKLEALHVKIVDGTCPVVTRSQNLAKQYHLKGFQVAIVGKHGHPEIIGIVGHTDNTATVIQYDEDLQRLKQDRPTFVMAQTTINAQWYDKMVEKIQQRCKNVKVANTICQFVLKRDRKLPDFADQADVILVVGGHKSSNTKMLHSSCVLINPRSYHVVSTEEIDPDWFVDAESIGVTGSASTPLWLLREFVDTLNDQIENGWKRKA